MPPIEKTLSLREANQAFARIVREVEGGAAFTITRNGAPVARIVPVEGAPRRLTPEQEVARARTRAQMAGGWPLAAGPLDRDAIHER
ncbi:MAG TPA: type II toxin-antitoxin system Phd/YefM family antitoxin [Caulobacteraceae bacterium]|jgi:prevent-host-death family protein|nr:type II toxin-antitoxin system Phd/YefM family antitoxin [Caulobacteraceae bacterium]